MDAYLTAFKTILSISATITTILQFLSGVFICKKFIKKGNSDDVCGFSFISGVLNCVMWLKYGTLIGDTSVIVVNLIGGILQLSYLFLYYIYSEKKTELNKKLCLMWMSIFSVLFLSYMHHDQNQIREFFGIIACACSIIFFGAPLTMLVHVLTIKSTENLPFLLILSSFLVSGQWFIYGCLIGDTFIQVPNFLGSCLAGFQLSLFYFFPNKADKNSQVPLLPQ